MEIVNYLEALLVRLNDMQPTYEEEMWDLHQVVLEDDCGIQEMLRYTDLKDEVIPAIKDAIHHLDYALDSLRYLSDENIL